MHDPVKMYINLLEHFTMKLNKGFLDFYENNNIGNIAPAFVLYLLSLSVIKGGNHPSMPGCISKLSRCCSMKPGLHFHTRNSWRTVAFHTEYFTKDSLFSVLLK
jgi:hypothetical protein